MVNLAQNWPACLVTFIHSTHPCSRKQDSLPQGCYARSTGKGTERWPAFPFAWNARDRPSMSFHFASYVVFDTTFASWFRLQIEISASYFVSVSRLAKLWVPVALEHGWRFAPPDARGQFLHQPRAIQPSRAQTTNLGSCV